VVSNFLNFNTKELSILVFLKIIIINEPLVMAILKTSKNQQFSQENSMLNKITGQCKIHENQAQISNFKTVHE
jgi:hypothetical protein